MRALALACAALALATACGPIRKATRDAERLEGHYQLGDPGDGWRTVPSGGADRAYRNKDLAATIYTDSNCGPRYEDRPLPDLAKTMLGGVADLKVPPVLEETRQLDGREAYVARRPGELDGVTVELGVVVLKKDYCVYDIVLIAPPGGRFDDAWLSYEQLVAGFRTTP
ncbi:MAG: hypothetical protein H6741_12610 [Alphaproteobacteria bacterium]|nr:hypothetical protein [Alphaproteobacteria bacterium]MCB9793557.1 hypothetical protein [Alphaproteobacteria bacterium]